MVDMMTLRFSSQRLIEFALNKSVRFAYWGVHGNFSSHDFRFNTFVPWSKYRDVGKFTVKWDFMEFLVTSPEPPVVAVDAFGEPVF